MIRVSLLLAIWLFFPPAFAADAPCDPQGFADLVGEVSPAEARLAEVKNALDHDLADPNLALAKLKISSEGIRAEQFLGAGHSGVVYRVTHEGKEYALKLYKRKSFDARELPSILLQKHLGDLGMAPKVMGVLDEADAAKFFENNEFLFEGSDFYSPDEVRYGLLMEVVEGTPYKQENWRQVDATAAEKERLLQAADQLVKALAYLEISPYDIDFKVTNDKQLKLIDLTFYQRRPIKEEPMRREFRKYLNGLLNVVNTAEP